MAAPLSTVFLSYRRNVSSFIARAVFQDLRQHGYDVFMDVESIDSGQFEPIILAQIAARAYFLVLLTPGTLAGCQEPDDWLRREIEYAMELGRNIVPILVNDFRFDDNALASLTGRLRDLPRYNGLPLPQDYFNEAMERLRTRFLRQPGQGIITPGLPRMPLSSSRKLPRRPVNQHRRSRNFPPKTISTEACCIIPVPMIMMSSSPITMLIKTRSRPSHAVWKMRRRCVLFSTNGT